MELQSRQHGITKSASLRFAKFIFWIEVGFSQNIRLARYHILTGNLLGREVGCAGIFPKSEYARDYFLECVIELRKL